MRFFRGIIIFLELVQLHNLIQRFLLIGLHLLVIDLITCDYSALLSVYSSLYLNLNAAKVGWCINPSPQMYQTCMLLTFDSAHNEYKAIFILVSPISGSYSIMRVDTISSLLLIVEVSHECVAPTSY